MLPGDPQPWYVNIGLPKTLGENAWVGYYDLEMTTADDAVVHLLIRGTLPSIAPPSPLRGRVPMSNILEITVVSSTS